MKEFKKWQKEFCSRRCCSGTSSCNRCTNDHEVAWRAAVTWALDLWWHKSNNPELFRELLEDELGLDK